MPLELTEQARNIIAFVTPIIIMVVVIGYNYISFKIGQSKRSV